jgi:hypothetical protein
MEDAKIQKVYKIRLKGTNLYSTGGSTPTFKENKGKVWSNIGNLKNHLVLLGGSTSSNLHNKKRWLYAKYDQCEIVEYTLLVSENVTDISDKILKEYMP